VAWALYKEKVLGLPTLTRLVKTIFKDCFKGFDYYGYYGFY
jgi:hypothetical protein